MNDLLQKNISDILGLDGLSEGERMVFLDRVGETVLDSAVLRLVASLDEKGEAALDAFLKLEPDADTLMKHLFEHHPNFETLLEEEILALKEEMVAVLGSQPETVAGE